jgi:tripartite-type tricarboxylate transporter receptor subunit TctC
LASRSSSTTGRALLLADASAAINASLYDRLSFNFIRDILPVAAVISTPLLMVANPALPAMTVAEFIAYAKASPGRINMASAGTGSPSHLAGELFKMMTGIAMTHVPYRGAASNIGTEVVVHAPPDGYTFSDSGTIIPRARNTASGRERHAAGVHSPDNRTWILTRAD